MLSTNSKLSPSYGRRNIWSCGYWCRKIILWPLMQFYLRERWNWTFNGSHDDTKSSTSRPLDEDESPDDPSPPDAAATAKGCDRCRYHSHTTEASVPATNQLFN
ncbi:hypothetical protein DAPPUDRAFT_109267 [Daphnia pulex]|uniref:Uncharacterized protein n=1 Tax=Daphnia pulex TaxID=6669 RepID=E9H2H4_DAPPU|nr:hypothetical protein DAPPUDRAFT_109267 [Daphnia pulex]|eukprot:EFX74068.1 hypothetical protein DAPPUDRAFT_109267 [Daphnia pulex]